MIYFVIAAALPLLYGIQNFEAALVSVSAVFMSVLFLELAFFASCKFRRPVKSALTGFALLACVLIPLSLARESLWPGIWQRPADFFPLTFASAFVLARITTSGTNPLAFRARLWGSFALLVLVFGALCEGAASFQTFPAGPFWLIAFFLIAQRFFKKSERP